ncbi:acetate/propionate family kinase [Protaetiibacter intestinalis]|uniref:Acetate kinase n=1 Tax=Protaetiibacter intestinalis TaxID=2419774 RepID=A0A387BAG6_9MICO|nr:acetate kinase [Protaetiibacter intestinalis]AYF99387.1 acetate kinase [Protaetiibacter intestinalis]
MRNVFVLNVGSSSIKYQVLDVDTGEVFAAGLVERIGVPGSGVTDHEAALAVVLAELAGVRIDAVGHRIVHGGTRFVQATVIDDDVEREIEALADLAPLHNPPGLAGIRAARAALPELTHVAVFDTAFHATITPAARDYAIDAEVAARTRIRRFGFHGTSYRYVSRIAAETLGRVGDPELKLVALHLGNGASATAIQGGRSVDTSMGMTPLEGLVMGTRSGDIDPAIPLYLAREHGFTIAQLDELLNKRSGLLGLAGRSDMRELVAAAEAGDLPAAHALDVYVHRLRHYIGAYAAVLGGIDALVFTAGVGENSEVVRRRAVAGLEFLGLAVDPARNAVRSPEPRFISPEGCTTAVLVVPTNEELEIARETRAAAPPPTR